MFVWIFILGDLLIFVAGALLRVLVAESTIPIRLLAYYNQGEGARLSLDAAKSRTMTIPSRNVKQRLRNNSYTRPPEYDGCNDSKDN